MTAEGELPRLGLIVPCRDEARVIAARIANLAWLAWPQLSAGREHRLVLVDDGSRDETAELARRALRAGFDEARPEGGRVRCELVRNRERAGKVGAILTALEQLAQVDVLVLCDADVQFGAGSLLALARAFASQPALAMGSGRQCFVDELPADGDCADLDQIGAQLDAGPHSGPAAGRFDRWTARVRSLESRFGRLFSVHGQCLAWRASLGLRPRAGFAADDLDLALQLRERPRGAAAWRIELLSGVRFFECKSAPGPIAEQQALRRARAYVQVLRANRIPSDGWRSRLQWLAYRSLPLYAPELSLAVPIASCWWLARASGQSGALAGALGWIALATTPAARRWLRLARVIRRARRAERAESLPEQWEMQRS